MKFRIFLFIALAAAAYFLYAGAVLIRPVASMSANIDKATAHTEIEPAVFSEAILTCRREKLDTVIAVIVDMSIHSGKNRMFLCDLQNRKVLHKALCCHGMGSGSTCEKP